MASKSGFRAILGVGYVSGNISTVYNGAELTDVSITVSHESVDVSDLGSIWKERTFGLMDWEVTGKKNYVSSAFIKLIKSQNTSTFWIGVKNPAGAIIFKGRGIVLRGSLAIPMGAITEEITIQNASLPGTSATVTVA